MASQRTWEQRMWLHFISVLRDETDETVLGITPADAEEMPAVEADRVDAARERVYEMLRRHAGLRKP